MLGTFLRAPGSEVALVSFDSKVKLRQGFSPAPSDLTKSLDAIPGGDAGSALLDAVQFSLRLFQRRRQDHRKVLVVISGQKDHDSQSATLEEVARQIIASDTEVYMVAYPPDFKAAVESTAQLFGPAQSYPQGSPGYTGVPGTGTGSSAAASFNILGLFSLLHNAGSQSGSNIPQTIADLTGGEYVLFKSRKGLDDALGLLANHADNRYQLSFKVKDPTPGLHRLEVLVRHGGGVEISARAGYWATATSAQSSPETSTKQAN